MWFRRDADKTDQRTISGSDLSLDGGETWTPMGTDALNSVGFGDTPCAGWAAGPDGRIARLGR